MSIRKTCGIYSITHKGTGRSYVGQSSRIGDRWLHHKSRLRGGKHANRFLQHAWSKHGEESFDFAVLEVVELDDAGLAACEQKWMGILKPEFNLAPIGGTTRGLKHPPRSAEFRQNMSKMRTGFRHSEETISRLKTIQSESTYSHSPAMRKHISEQLKKVVFVLTPKREAMYKSRRGLVMPDNTRAALKKANTGRKCSELTKQRVAECNRARLTGVKQSQSTIDKRAVSLRGRKRPEVGEMLRGRKRPAHVVKALHDANDSRFAARRMAIRQAILADPSQSSASIARALRVDRGTVCKYKKEFNSWPQ